MTGITHKRRLKQIESNLIAINQEINDGDWEDDCLQEAVNFQIEMNRMVRKLNQLQGRYDEKHREEAQP